MLWRSLALPLAVAIGCAAQPPCSATTAPPSEPLAEGERSVIHGVVTLDGGVAIEGAQMVIECAACEPRVLRETITNGDGLYAVRDLPPGVYEVWVMETPKRYNRDRLRVSRDKLDTSRTFALAEGVRARLDFALPMRSVIIVD